MSYNIRTIRALLSEKEHIAYCTAMDEPRDPFACWTAWDYEEIKWNDDDYVARDKYHLALDKFHEEQGALSSEIWRLRRELADAVAERKAFKMLRKIFA